MLRAAAILTSILFFGGANADDRLNEKLIELDRKSKEILGVSLKSVRFLLDDTPCVLVHSDLIKENNNWKYINELEKAGIVEKRTIKHKPKGQEKEMELIELTFLGNNEFDDCD
ncbi:hypothetical protein ACFL17_05900 [Pseudomonadota bacterium]